MDFVCSWLSRSNLQSATDSTPEARLRHARLSAKVPDRQSNSESGGALKLTWSFSRFFGLIAVAVSCCAQTQAASGGTEANPGRPTVSSPATLTPTGFLQFET